MDISWENPFENLKKCKSFFEKAESEEADILIFPETTCTGFTNNIDSAVSMFQIIYDEIKMMAVKHKINVIYGLISAGGNKARNQSIALNSSGDVLWQYTKIHPFSYSEEDLYFQKGSEIAFGEICGVCVSPFICYDLRFPEIFQAASDKAGLLAVIANWPQKRIEHWDILLKARAVENQSFVVGVNRVGIGNDIQYCGHSSIISPSGVILNPLSEKEELIVVEIDPGESDEYRKIFKVKQDRRHELYAQFYKPVSPAD